jgi:hypothetical protein
MVLIAGLLLAAAAPPSDALEFRRLDKAAACLIRKDRVAVANWAATDPGTVEEASGTERLSALIEKCAAGVAIGPLASAVALRLFNRYQTLRIILPGSPEERNRFANSVLAGASDRPRPVAVLRCAALMYPEAAEAFVRSEFGSRRESETRAAATAAIARCTPLSEQIRWTRLSLRLGLARQVYKMSPAAHLARGTKGAFAEEAARVR